MAVGALVSLLVWVVVVGLILWVVYWGVSQVPLPEPIATVVRVVLILVVCLVAINLLLQLLPGGFSPIRFPGRL